MRHEPGSLKPQAGGRMCGKIVAVGRRFCAERWAEVEFPSHHAEERHEQKVFDTADEARAWIEESSRQRGFWPVAFPH